MKFWLIAGPTILLVIFTAVATPIMRAHAQEVQEKDLKDKIKEAIKEKPVEEKPKTGNVILNLVVPKDCKITINEKPISYDKFEVLMEYTINAFVIDDIAYRNGQFTVLKMRSKE